MKLGLRLAGVMFASVLGACAAPVDTTTPRIAVGGTSPLVDMFTRIAAETDVPAELLASLSYLETRLRFVDASEHGATRIGLYGMSPADLARGATLTGVTDEAARHDHESSIRIAAALIREQAPAARTLPEFLAALEPALAAELRTHLARGIAGSDALGESLVVAARPEIDRGTGLGTITQALGNADYEPAKWVAAHSGNFSVSNRTAADITHIVIHTVQGSYSSCINWFKNPDAKVSAHYVVRSSDGEVTQMVKEKDTAWHDKCFNAPSLGIEHEGYVTEPQTWYTDAMYMSSAKLTAYLADKYDIPADRTRIQGHGETDDCSTHTDPGTGWDWARYMDLVQTSGTPKLTASDVTVDAPASLTSGDRATVTFSITNTGNVAWDLDLTRIGTAQPQDRESAFFVDGDWVSPARATGAAGRVEPGATGTFTFEIEAPDVREPIVFHESFQLVQEGMGWFGPDIQMTVQVMPRVTEDGAMDVGGCSAGGGAGSAGSACAMLALGALVRRRRNARAPGL